MKSLRFVDQPSAERTSKATTTATGMATTIATNARPGVSGVPSPFYPQLRAAPAAVFAAAAFLATACARATPVPEPDNPSPVPSAPAQHSVMPHPSHSQTGRPTSPQQPTAQQPTEFHSTWSGGACSFSTSSLAVTYTDQAGRQASLMLDALTHGSTTGTQISVGEVIGIVCSETYTALLLRHGAVVALGARPIFAGMEMLGYIGHGESLRFMVVNSYALLHGDAHGDFVSGQFDGRMLTVRTSLGLQLRMDAGDPGDGWYVF